MGTKLDMARRKELRKDSPTIWNKISMTRQWIFERGYGVGSVIVARILGTSQLTVMSSMDTLLELSHLTAQSMAAKTSLNSVEIVKLLHRKARAIQ